MSRRRWDDDLLLTIPLDPNMRRCVHITAPHDGLTTAEGERVAEIVRAWAYPSTLPVSLADGSEDGTPSGKWPETTDNPSPTKGI